MTDLAAAHALVAEQAQWYIRCWRPHYQALATIDQHDLTQTVWVIVANICARYDPTRGPLEHFLRANLKSSLINVLRLHQPWSRSTKQTFYFNPLPALDDDNFWEPWTTEDDTVPEMADLIARLSPIQREVVLLHVYGDQSFTEIASTLGRDRASVWEAWTRARKTLRTYFQEDVA